VSAILKKSTGTSVTEHLRERIAVGKYPRGGFLPSERQLADELGVSRVMVREAVRKLEQMGMLRVRHGIGVDVVNDTAAPVRQALSWLMPDEKLRLRDAARARLVVEPELAALAAASVSQGDVRELTDVHEALVEADTLDAAIEADIAFHDAIARFARNQALALMLSAIAGIGRQSREMTIERHGQETAVKHHAGVLEAIANQDPALARRRMKRHIQLLMEGIE